MSWDDAEFLIKHGSTAPEESLNADAIFLLMEYFRRTDEVSSVVDSVGVELTRSRVSEKAR